MINKNTKMLLFRYSNYRKFRFIEEHRKIIQDSGYVWMMKMGKRTSLDRIGRILESGGYMVLKAPVSDGNLFYLGHFTAFREDLPDEKNHMPQYYAEIVEDENFWDSATQFFKLESIVPLDERYAEKLCLEKNRKKVLDVIHETRTAVMFIENEIDMDIY